MKSAAVRHFEFKTGKWKRAARMNKSILFIRYTAFLHLCRNIDLPFLQVRMAPSAFPAATLRRHRNMIYHFPIKFAADIFFRNFQFLKLLVHKIIHFLRPADEYGIFSFRCILFDQISADESVFTALSATYSNVPSGAEISTGSPGFHWSRI